MGFCSCNKPTVTVNWLTEEDNSPSYSITQCIECGEVEIDEPDLNVNCDWSEMYDQCEDNFDRDYSYPGLT